jgi:hypothetical protein
MRFESKTDEQIASEGLPPEGWCEAEVVASEEQVSKKGNDMICLTLKLYTANGERQKKDYLLSKFAKKLKHFCEAAGLESQYTLGTLEAGDCYGKVVMAEIAHEEQTEGKYAGQMQAQIVDYKVVERKTAAKPAAKPTTTAPQKPVAAVITDQDIPFFPIDWP